MIEWSSFFLPETRVLALPNWEAPRLFIPAHSLTQRWTRSAFYPAFRLSARLYRLALRARAATAMMEVKVVPCCDWSLGNFIQEVLPRATSVSVLVGTPGPAQKITVQLWTEGGQVIGYLKYAEKAAARKRLRQEYEILANVPSGRGPVPLKYGPWQDGEALLTTPLSGRSVPVSGLPAPGLLAFCRDLVVAPPVALDEHPWVRGRRPWGDVDAWLEPLADRPWPVVVQHGDLVAWNLRRRPDGALSAFDWEYGTVHGFPHLDLAYYVLQLAALIYRWKPRKAAKYTEAFLTQASSLGLSARAARSIVRLSAFDAYQKALDDGHTLDAPLQRWRRSVWADQE